ncbi:monooxygenase [Starkeya sp. 3C]|uniref:Dibenzothiophene monooxygenase n=1 Tax=Ancylobacter moscoviensis TaxID=2597768 RepID=A0ABY3DM14_9HYPH|nr:acyl-CoA dehydrogenase family protein [Ancylobacter moscoviensis]TSJ60211.1 monooxygenase [Ancylobacter moscoviensis]
MTATQIEQAWGAGPSPRYETLAARFRPLFERIRANATERERSRTLPHAEIGWLKEAGFTAVRLPEAEGGADASLPEFFNLLIELSAADSNLTQALRAHFGFVEEIIRTDVPGRREIWLPRLARGETAGSARSEAGDAAQAAFETTLRRHEDHWRIAGRKFYTTGSLYAEWIHVATTRAEDGGSVTAVVRRDAPGVQVVDDWDGFGQTLTASGTALFDEVDVQDADLVEDASIFGYTLPFYQLVHLSTLAGIARAAARDVAEAVARRQRSYSHAAGPLPRLDPQVLQVVGRVRGAAYAAGAIVTRVAEAVERAANSGDGKATLDPAALAVAELESAQSVSVITDLVFNATTVLFDALGASATLRSAGLDRHWRNARTLASHNPRIYKDRIVGDFAVNGTLPPQSWRIGRV